MFWVLCVCSDKTGGDPQLTLTISFGGFGGPSEPRLVANAMGPCRSFVFARVYKQLPQLWAWMEHINNEYNRRYGTVVEATKGVAKMGNAPKSKYQKVPRSTKGRRYQGYSVRAPFGLGRMSVTRILVQLTRYDPRSMLRVITPKVWSILTAWVLEYRHNNMYHIQFAELFERLIMANPSAIQVRCVRD